MTAATGTTGRVTAYPTALLATLGLFSPFLREVSNSSHQFRGAPFIIDATETSARLGVQHTPWDAALDAIEHPAQLHSRI